MLPTPGINRAAAQRPAGVDECLPLDFRRANLLQHELRRTVRLPLKGCAILDRKRVVKDIGGDVACGLQHHPLSADGAHHASAHDNFLGRDETGDATALSHKDVDAMDLPFVMRLPAIVSSGPIIELAKPRRRPSFDSSCSRGASIDDFDSRGSGAADWDFLRLENIHFPLYV